MCGPFSQLLIKTVTVEMRSIKNCDFSKNNVHFAMRLPITHLQRQLRTFCCNKYYHRELPVTLLIKTRVAKIECYVVVDKLPQDRLFPA